MTLLIILALIPFALLGGWFAFQMLIMIVQVIGILVGSAVDGLQILYRKVLCKFGKHRETVTRVEYNQDLEKDRYIKQHRLNCQDCKIKLGLRTVDILDRDDIR